MQKFPSSLFFLLVILNLSEPASSQVQVAGTLPPFNPPLTYPTLGAAFNAINGAGGTDVLTVSILGSTTELAPAVLNQTNYTVNISPAVPPPLSISGNMNNDMIVLNGADNVTFNGLGYLTLINSNTGVSAGTILLTNSANNNVFKDLLVRGSCVSINHAVINIINGIGPTGCDNNTFEGLDVGAAGMNRPAGGFYLMGTSPAIENNNNTIKNCFIHDYFNPAGINAGIGSQAYNSGTVITGNHFYQTSTYTSTANNAFTAISIIDGNFGSGNGFVIEDNFIGGTAPFCGGSPFTITGDFANQFGAIILRAANGPTNSIKGNTIRNLNLTYVANISNGNPFIGIGVYGGNTDVGSLLKPNVIGHDASNGSIVLNTKLSGTNSCISIGILDNARPPTGIVHNCNISYNTIGGVDVNATAHSGTPTGSSWFLGIQVIDNDPAIVQNNIVGSQNHAQNIRSIGTPSINVTMSGMYIWDASANIQNNIIKNLVNSSLGVLQGIIYVAQNPGHSFNCTNNEVGFLTANPTGFPCRLDGILWVATVSGIAAPLNISNNSVHHLTTDAGVTGTAFCHGIRVTSFSGVTGVVASGNINNNTTYEINNNSSSPTGATSGITHETGIGNSPLNITGNIIHTVNSGIPQLILLNAFTNGALYTSSTGLVTISNNFVYNGHRSCACDITGINVRRRSSLVTANTVYGLSIVPNGSIYGIYLDNPSGVSCNSTVTNNMLYLGASSTSNNDLWGIDVAGNALHTCVVDYNSVVVDGAAVSGAAGSAAFRRASLSVITSLRNNIFYNNRWGASNAHYAIQVINTSGWVSANAARNYVVTRKETGFMSRLGTTNYINHIDGAPVNGPGSYSAKGGLTTLMNDLFVSPTNANLTINLNPAEYAPVNGTGVPVSTTVDRYGTARSATAPCIGAYEFTAPKFLVWHGYVNNNWHNAANWVINAVPTPTDDCIILHVPNNPHIFIGPGTTRDIILKDSVNIFITAASTPLQIHGNLIAPNAPAFANLTGHTGYATMTGVSSQNISGYLTVENIRTNNTAGVSIGFPSTLNIKRSLGLQSGNFAISGATVKLLSNAPDSCAIIDNFSPGFSGTLSGNITAQRFISGTGNV
ncbi:MAG: hypothetical protein RML37_09390, partial [Chitinophagales bacterium]|nr:hypothetical protein [Chitinophagales bacterium]